MRTKVTDVDSQVIHYLEVIRRGHAPCIDLMNELERRNRNEDFIGVCMVRVLAPRGLMIPYLPHKCDGKLMFLLCKKCSS